MAGIDSKKENSPAEVLFTPVKRAVEIVTPDLDSPGSTPIPWARPIIRACRRLTVSKALS